MKNSDVTVRLTTTSRRIRHVEDVIRSLLNQDMPARQVVLWLSREPFLMDEGVAPEDVPESLRALESRPSTNFNMSLKRTAPPGAVDGS